MNNNLNLSKINNSKEKGVVLPTVVVSMVIISLFSALILSFVLSAKLSSNLLVKNSNMKLKYEKIYFEFKQGENVCEKYSNTYTYSAFDIESNNIKNDNIKAIIIKNNENISMFAVFEEILDNKNDVIYQTSNISITLEEDGTFEYYGYLFKCDQVLT